MKKLVSLLVVILFMSCEGPQGLDGFDGVDGGLIVASAFEIEVDFDAVNNYEIIEPYGFDLFPFDVTLVYVLWDVIDGQDVWRLMPQSNTFDDGTELVYNFDYTLEDVRLFLDGDTDLDTLDTVWTENQVFRVVVVPADNVGRVDYSDLKSVMSRFNITSFEKRN